jgi:hypothetical protein
VDRRKIIDRGDQRRRTVKKLIISICSAALLAGGGVAVAIAGASPSVAADSFSVIRVVGPVTWQGDPDLTQVGDRLEYSARLLDVETRDVIGRARFACTVVQANERKHTNQCVGTYVLPDGTITTQAYAVIDGDFLAVAITGGTGLYFGAGGQVEFEPADGGGDKVTFELS